MYCNYQQDSWNGLLPLAEFAFNNTPNATMGISLFFVKATYFCTTRPLKKLSAKNLGPFKIITQVGQLSFTHRLPEQLWAVHPMFHISQLEPTPQNMILNRVQPPSPPIEVNKDIEYKIYEILDSKIKKCRKC